MIKIFIGNPKFSIRNKIKARISKNLRQRTFWTFHIRICDLCFGFRIFYDVKIINKFPRESFGPKDANRIRVSQSTAVLTSHAVSAKAVIEDEWNYRDRRIPSNWSGPVGFLQNQRVDARTKQSGLADIEEGVMNEVVGLCGF
ncbi:MAG: hypothetical protein IID45_02155 [Planctomycetes bacterium]|nr:hypothetical protein [Planctomycetota bacterium]